MILQNLLIIIYIKVFVKMLDAQISDIEFYIMKINRLELDLAATQQELMAARLRLRTAEDYQIKYQLLLKQTQQENSRIRLYEKQEEEKISQLITLKLQDRDQYWSQQITKLERELSEKYKREMSQINQEFVGFRKKHEKCASSGANKIDQQDILAFKNKKLQKQNEALQQKITLMKKQFQKAREEESRQIKQSLSVRNKEKQQNQRRIYRQKIDVLEKTISDLENSLIQAKTKADPQREKEIQKLKRELTNQINKSNEEIQIINKKLSEKHDQIQDLLRDKYKVEQFLIKQKKQLKDYAKTLEDKLFEKEHEHQIELINLKERMSKIRQQQAQGLKIQIIKIQQNFDKERQSWNIVIVDKDKQIERVKNKCDDDTQRHKQDRAKQLKKIEELKERLKQYEGEKQVEGNDHLLKSMKQIDAKQADFTNYQNGVTFLDRQLKKTISKLEQKNIEVTKLVKQLNDQRKQSQQEIQILRQKSRKDKKYYTDKIAQLEEEILDVNDQIRNKERQAKKRQKDFEGKINQLQKENNSLKDLVEEMQKDYTRIVQNKKAIELSFRQQRQRGMTSKSDLTMVKKQKWLEMERQKNQLEAIFKQKQEQLKNKHEVQIQKFRHERDRLRSENEILKGLVETKKENSEQDKQNKQTIYSQYHKKMATLNLQIALTKNIYDALIQAKSRKPKESKVSEFDRVDQDASRSDHEQEGSPFKDSKGPKFFNHSDFQKLAMSFNPRDQQK